MELYCLLDLWSKFITLGPGIWFPQSEDISISDNIIDPYDKMVIKHPAAHNALLGIKSIKLHPAAKWKFIFRIKYIKSSFTFIFPFLLCSNFFYIYFLMVNVLFIIFKVLSILLYLFLKLCNNFCLFRKHFAFPL